MSPRRLRLDQALGAIPESDELAPLRDALIGASREDAERAWAASEAYATLDTRLADTGALDEQVSALAERVRARTEAVLRHTVRALRALKDGDEAEAAGALVSAGELEEAEGRLEAAERYYRKALDLGRKPRDRRAEGLALRRLGRVARARGRLEEALDLYRRGYDSAEAMRDAGGMVVACQGAGNVYMDQGLWERAREWYLRGLAHLETGTPSRMLWELYNNLSVVELRSGDVAESSAWLDRAEGVVRALDDPRGPFFLSNARGRVGMARELPREAEDAFRKALESARTPQDRGIALLNLAESLLQQERLVEAEAVARELEKTAIVHRTIYLLLDLYRMLGAIARARGDAEGFLFYEQALDLCRERGAPLVELAATQHEYALFEAAQGSPESAAERLREALALYERLGMGPELSRARAELARITGSAAPAQGPTRTDQPGANDADA
ncbi:MAG TPA: tetratricopeptide repeat protein [Longimicrobiaceae bacterium]|nr:tetratricopeptide repeat protein [Longimicrobiaceae bacterium]